MRFHALTWLRAARHRSNEVLLSPERRPSSNPTTLMSSSISSQRIPLPSSRNRQLSLSERVDSYNLGYQSSGTLTFRPLSRTTVRNSSERLTSTDRLVQLSTPREDFIPFLQKILLMSLDYSSDVADIPSPQTPVPRQFQGFQPELRYMTVAFNVYVRGLSTVG